MGQYYKIVNLDKKQFLHPHAFGDGLKLMEFGSSGQGTMNGLAILLADGNNRGGGDLRSDNPIIGSWAGDRIVVAGDYADRGNHLSEQAINFFANDPKNQENIDHWKDKCELPVEEYPINLYVFAESYYEDISEQVVEALCDDVYVKERLNKNREWYLESKARRV
jgi:hypothetical protein